MASQFNSSQDLPLKDFGFSASGSDLRLGFEVEANSFGLCKVRGIGAGGHPGCD